MKRRESLKNGFKALSAKFVRYFRLPGFGGNPPKFLLDTNACIHYLNHGDSPVRRRMESLRPADAAVCSVVKAGLYYGADKSMRKTENLEGLEYFFSTLQSLPF